MVWERLQSGGGVTHDNHLASFADRQFHIVDGKIFKIEECHHEEEEEIK